MTISDLSHDQQVALAALLEWVIASDGVVSAAEGQEIGLIAGELGDDTYRALLDEAEARCPDQRALKDCLPWTWNSGIRSHLRSPYGKSHPWATLPPWLEGARHNHIPDWLVPHAP